MAFTRVKIAVFVDGSFWHGHPSKWQPGRWTGYWNDKIERNILRDKRQNEALRENGWEVLRFWDFEIEHDVDAVANRVRAAVQAARLSTLRSASDVSPGNVREQ